MISTQDAPGCTQHGICSEEPSDIDSDHEDYEEAMEAGQTSGPRSRCKDTSGGTTIPDLNSTPQQYPSHHHGNNEAQVIRKGYHADLMLRSYNRNVLRPVYLSKDVYRTVFKSLPIEVSLAVVVDGQPVAEPPQNLKGKMVKYERRKPNFSLRVNLYFSESLDAHKYAGHRLSYYTAESGGPAGPKLTLYLKSPAEQQQEEETEWVTHICRKGAERLSSTQQRIHLSWSYVVKAFPDAQHDRMNLQLVFFKDDVQVEGVDGSSTLRQYQFGFQVVISESATAALLGSRLWKIKAKPPNLLKVYCIGCADDEQLPRGDNQTTSPSTAATTAIVPAAASQHVPRLLQTFRPPNNVRPAQLQALAADQHMHHNQQQSVVHSSKCTQMHDKHRHSQPADSGYLAAAVAGEASSLTATKRSSQALGGLSAVTAAPGAVSAADVQAVDLLREGTQPTKRLRLAPSLRAETAMALKPTNPNNSTAAAAAQGQLPTATASVGAHVSEKHIGKSAVDIPVVAAAPGCPRVKLEVKQEDAVATKPAAVTSGASAPAQPLGYAANTALPAAQPKLPSTQVHGAVNMAAQAQGGNTSVTVAETDVIVILDTDSDDDNEPPAAPQQQQQQQQNVQPGHQSGMKSDVVRAEQQALPAAPTVAGQSCNTGTQQEAKPEEIPAEIPAIAANVGAQAATQVQQSAEAAVPAVPAFAVVQTAGAAAAAAPSALTAVEPSSATLAAPSLQTGDIVAAAAAAAPSAAPSAPANTDLPAGFILTDCNNDILLAGRQLTDLLDHLHAPDQQVMQLNGYIISLSHQSDDDNRVVRFWYDYSQIRLWVKRRNEQHCKKTIQQMLHYYSSCQGP